MLGQGCLEYRYDMKEAGAGNLNVYQYTNGRREGLLSTHQFNQSGIQQIVFTSSQSDLTEVSIIDNLPIAVKYL